MSEEIYVVTLGDIFKNIETEEQAFKFKDYIKKLQEENEQLHSIIKEIRDILKRHICNPSGLKDGWHIDCWNNEDISKLNENLGILDKENNNG